MRTYTNQLHPEGVREPALGSRATRTRCLGARPELLYTPPRGGLDPGTHLPNKGDGGVNGVLDGPANRLARAVLVLVVLVLLALLSSDAVSLLVLSARRDAEGSMACMCVPRKDSNPWLSAAATRPPEAPHSS